MRLGPERCDAHLINCSARRRPVHARSDQLSVSYRSRLSAACANEARQTVLSFFRAPPGYTVVFTANASGALKLVGESFPFGAGSTYVLGADSHNSVHGIRKFAHDRGAEVCYIDATEVGGFDVAHAKVRVQSAFPVCPCARIEPSANFD